MSELWGIDLGGTKIEGVILNGESETICRLRIPTEADRGYEHILSQLALMVSRLEAESGQRRPRRIGIGTPGAADPTSGLMKNCNTTALNGQPLPADLQETLGIEVRLANDANCFALAEARAGAAKGAEVVFGIILGTGVGGGLVVEGRALNGAQGIAGEWGHNVADPDGSPCYCGRRGCVETILSGPALERDYRIRGGDPLRLPEIVARAESGELQAQATLSHLCEWFGRCAAVVVNIVDPHVIVLGGGVGNIRQLYSEGAAALARHVFNDQLDTKVVRPKLGDSAGVIGAAWLAA